MNIEYRKDLFYDNYLLIADIGNGQGLYNTVYGDIQTMPIAWAHKVVRYLEAGNYKAGLKLIDIVETYVRNKYQERK